MVTQDEAPNSENNVLVTAQEEVAPPQAEFRDNYLDVADSSSLDQFLLNARTAWGTKHK